MSTDPERPGRVYRGVDPRGRADARSARLIEAAVEVFGTTGYRSATVDRVCLAAGLTKRYFYESFADSEALLLAAYERVTDELRSGILAGAAAMSGDGLRATMRGGVEGFFGAIEQDPRRARIAFVEILGVSPAVDAAYRAQTLAFVDAVRAVGEEALGVDAIPEPLQRNLTIGIVGAVLLIAQVWVLEGFAQPIAAVVDAAHALVMSALAPYAG